MLKRKVQKNKTAGGNFFFITNVLNQHQLPSGCIFNKTPMILNDWGQFTMMCVSTVYSVFSESCENILQAYITRLGFEQMTFAILEQCLTNQTTQIARYLEVVRILCFGSRYRNDISDWHQEILTLVFYPLKLVKLSKCFILHRCAYISADADCLMVSQYEQGSDTLRLNYLICRG